MKIFTKLYESTLRLSAHRQAPYWLGLVSFSESVFFPIPPDVMLAPMTLSRPQRANYLAMLTTLSSVAGGLIGYLIGLWFIDLLLPYIDQWGYRDSYQRALELFEQHGIWVIFVASFTPIPFKIMTIASGSLGFALIPFLITATIGRGLRFFLVARLVAWKGQAIMDRLHNYIDAIGYAVIAAIVIYAGFAYFS